MNKSQLINIIDFAKQHNLLDKPFEYVLKQYEQHLSFNN